MTVGLLSGLPRCFLVFLGSHLRPRDLPVWPRLPLVDNSVASEPGSVVYSPGWV